MTAGPVPGQRSLTTFVGRERELDELRSLFLPGSPPAFTGPSAMLTSHTQLGDVPPPSHLHGASDHGVGATEEQKILAQTRPAGPRALVAGVVPRRTLFGQLAEAERVVHVSAPAGSGKTVLVRSWLAQAGLDQRAGWVPAGSRERDPRWFWIPVADALRGTAAGAVLVRPLTAAPDLDGWTVVERLLKDLAPLADRLWLVIDDAHDLGPEVLAQLELLVLRAPPALRFVLATRHDLRLGLHRLRLAGELTELRADDLRFSVAEARALFGAAGVQLPAEALARLHERTEGWAAGLRLAALSLAGHPDPARFAAEFSGSERTVADYLLAEVLERQSEEVRRVLLRTSLLERVNGDLADTLTESSGGERILHDLERAGAFVVSLDAARSWFRYHRLFADLLQLELRRTEPGEVSALHRAAAEWLARNGYPMEAVRHAQAAQDWGLAARLLTDHWPDEYLGGRESILGELLAGFPGAAVAADAELTAVRAADEMVRGSLDEAGRQLALAASGLDSMAADRRGRVQILLSLLRFSLARRRMDVPVAGQEAQRLLACIKTADAARLGLGEVLRATALISLGVTEIWAFRFEDAERHLEQGVDLARRLGQPYLEFFGLTYWAHGMMLFGLDGLQPRRGRQAVELAERHGWGEEPLAGIAYTALAGVQLGQGQLADAESWLERAENALRTEVEPAAGMSLRYARAVLELARRRYPQALTAFRGADELAAELVRPNTSVTSMRARMVQALVRAGQADQAAAILAGLDSGEQASTEMRTATASLRLAEGNPRAAAEVLAPVLGGSVLGARRAWMMAAWLQEAAARDALDDRAAAGRALERALDLADSTGVILPFLLDPAPALLEHHRTTHSSLVTKILALLGTSGGLAPRDTPASARPAEPARLVQPLTDGEGRILRYLPTHLTAPEIASELSLSTHTVTTHLRHLYAKLGVHRRAEAVEHARALGLLAPAPRGSSGARAGQES
jgi:LuxR family transcriptional regulator, maltose regulon positive regulatory protein